MNRVPTRSILFRQWMGHRASGVPILLLLLVPVVVVIVVPPKHLRWKRNIEHKEPSDSFVSLRARWTDRIPAPLRSPVLTSHARQVLAPDLVKNDGKDQHRTHHRLPGNRVPENDAANGDGKQLSGRHDDRKDNGSEFLDGVENKELAGGRRNGRDNVVIEGHGICRQEFVDHRNVSRDEQTGGGNDDRAAVDGQHHLVLVDVAAAVLLVNLVLPLGREGIATNVHDHKDQAFGFRRRIVVRGLGGE
mmetsp:Transcript_22475/g.62606  ORF Transcript_22475/g.62606 Transcript_22475/m.62606 type:complete len:247 (-) Transcript_22475:1257-1997(-)